MSAQQLVGAAGIGLIAANAWTGRQRRDLAAILSPGDAGGTATEAHRAAKEVGVELLAVGVLVLLAGTSGPASGAALSVIVALWIVWLMKRTATTPSN